MATGVKAMTTIVFEKIIVEDLQTLTTTQFDMSMLPDSLLLFFGEFFHKHSIFNDLTLNFTILFFAKEGTLFCFCHKKLGYRF